MINQLLGPLLKRLPENNKLERIWVLAKTDFIERYYGTRLGIVWALINPFFQLVVYYIAFSVIFAVEIPNFALYVFSGLILMMFFSEATTKGLSLMGRYKAILENININKLDLFYGAMISASIAFGFNLFVYILLSFFFDVIYNINALFAPLILLNFILIILAVQLILSVLYIFFRDINHLWDMMLLLLFWGSPIFYSKDVIVEKLPILLYINPLTGIFINIRETLLYSNPPDWNLFLLNYITAIVLLIIALLLFKRFSPKAVEII